MRSSRISCQPHSHGLSSFRPGETLGTRLKSCLFLLFSSVQSDGTKLFNFVHGCQSWSDYLTKMSADGTWGDHVILHAVANCYEICIHVISSLSPSHDVIISPEQSRDVESSNWLVLGHLHEHHYVSLQPKRGE